MTSKPFIIKDLVGKEPPFWAGRHPAFPLGSEERYEYKRENHAP